MAFSNKNCASRFYVASIMHEEHIKSDFIGGDQTCDCVQGLFSTTLKCGIIHEVHQPYRNTCRKGERSMHFHCST